MGGEGGRGDCYGYTGESSLKTNLNNQEICGINLFYGAQESAKEKSLCAEGSSCY